jgi:hypothetical protein
MSAGPAAFVRALPGVPFSRRFLRAVTLAALLSVVTNAVSADNTDPTNAGAKYAWGENVGWITARPTGEAYGPGGSGMQVSDTDVTGYLWGENIGWINLSCLNDSSCGGAAGNWGVKNDGLGHLSGYAWAENAGWISFSCNNNPSTCATTNNYGVTIAPYDIVPGRAQLGHLSGYAWGENIGWVSFNCSNDSSCGTVNYFVQTGAPDSDGDGCRDAKEPTLSLDMWNPWDFYSVPIPALFAAPDPTTDFRDDKVAASDAQAVFAYFKAFAKAGTTVYDQDLDLNGVADGIQYDRTVLGPGQSGPPDGAIGAQDAQLALAQFKLFFKC